MPRDPQFKPEIEIDGSEVATWVQANYEPEDVFPENELRRWAEANGYVEKEDS